MIDVSVVIVSYRESPEVLRACFSRLQASTGVSMETIVVDNAADPSVRSMVETMAARYIANPENKGFAYAVNQGMKVGVGRYFLLLNPDTEVQPDSIAQLVRHLDKDTDVGIGSGIIRYPDGTLQDSIRRFPTPWDQLLVLLKAPHVFKRLTAIDRYMMRDVDPLQTQDVDSIMGAFMLIRREVTQQIGFFDERYFIWFEEVDYCKMAVDAGWKVRHYADVEIVHHKGHSFGKVATLRKQKWVRTSWRKYARKHHGGAVWLAFWALTPVFLVLAYGAAAIKRK